MNKNNIKIGFFGTPEYSVITLNKLKSAGFDICFVVTNPDRPEGRGLKLKKSEVKIWAEEQNIPIFQPEKVTGSDFFESLKKYNCDIFIVMAYGKIIPDEILNIPKHKSLNIHPSLLPKYRGPSPIESAILAGDKETGVTIIRMDSEMDHGPIVAQKKISPDFFLGLGNKIVEEGSDLLISTLSDWIAGKIPEIEQDHSQATYTKKIKKEDGLIDLKDDDYKNYLKYLAYKDWPSIYYFKDNKRIKITEAEYRDNKFIIEKVIPEGKSEINFSTKYL